MNYICVDGVGSLLEELLYCSEEKFEGIIKWTMVPNRAAWLFHRSWNGAINLREERWSCPKNIHCYRTRGVFLSREKFQTSGWNVTRTGYDRSSFDKEANVTLWSGYNDLHPDFRLRWVFIPSRCARVTWLILSHGIEDSVTLRMRRIHQAVKPVERYAWLNEWKERRFIHVYLVFLNCFATLSVPETNVIVGDVQLCQMCPRTIAGFHR